LLFWACPSRPTLARGSHVRWADILRSC
jgi:hypothetical protein